MSGLMHLRARLFNSPLAYDAGKAMAVLGGIGERVAGGALRLPAGIDPVAHAAFSGGRPSAGVLSDRIGRAYDRAGYAPFDVVDGVAIIPVEGSLVHKGDWLEAESGVTSYQGLQTQVSRAHRHPSVRGVIFEFDTFGGEVSGVFQTAAMIAALSADKPTIAILTDYALSAGYLLASQARSIVMPMEGAAGSIGAIILHADFSGHYEKEGVAISVVRAGQHKASGNPYEPLPDRERNRMQTSVDAVRDRFADVVAAGRQGAIDKAGALATEADSLDAEEALAAGLVDAIADPVEAMTTFMDEIKRS